MYHTNNLMKRMQTARAIAYLAYDPGSGRNRMWIYNRLIEPLGISYNVFCAYLREHHDEQLAAAEPLSYHVLLGLWTSVQEFIGEGKKGPQQPSPERIEQDLFRGRMLLETVRRERREAGKCRKRVPLPAPAL